MRVYWNNFVSLLPSSRSKQYRTYATEEKKHLTGHSGIKTDAHLGLGFPSSPRCCFLKFTEGSREKKKKKKREGDGKGVRTKKKSCNKK